MHHHYQQQNPMLNPRLYFPFSPSLISLSQLFVFFISLLLISPETHQLSFVAAAASAASVVVDDVDVGTGDNNNNKNNDIHHHEYHAEDQQRIIQNSNDHHHIVVDSHLTFSTSSSSSDPLLFSDIFLRGGNDDDDIIQKGEGGRHHVIVNRAPSGISALANDAPNNLNIEFGQIQHWVFPKEAVLGGALVSSSSSSSSSEEESGEIRFEKGGGNNEDEDGDHWEGTELVDIEGGETDDDNDRRDEDNRRTVYITFNTCLQPSSSSGSSAAATATTITTTDDNNEERLPQLILYISQSATNQRPGPDGPPDRQKEVRVQNGYAGIKIKNASGDIYIGVFASKSQSSSSSSDGDDDDDDRDDRSSNTSHKGIYNYEIAASVNRPHHSFDAKNSNLFLVDTDTTSALFVTEKLVSANSADNNATLVDDDDDDQEILDSISLLAYNMHSNASTIIKGLEHSHCALLKSHSTPSKQNIIKTLRSNTGKVKPRIQIHLTSLTPNTTYTTYLILTSSPNQKTRLFSPTTIKTPAASGFSSSCTIIHTLPFCNAIAYPVPFSSSSNNNNQTLSTLQQTYDNHAHNLYKNFSYALSQIACETTSSARYSLARSCDDCAAAYKAWLCAVSIPRCAPVPVVGVEEEQQEQRQWLKHREPGQSRNEMIDRVIKPGPYMEVLPCLDLCWDMLKACPAELGFACPSGGMERGFYYDDSSNEEDEDEDEEGRRGEDDGEMGRRRRCNGYVG